MKPEARAARRSATLEAKVERKEAATHWRCFCGKFNSLTTNVCGRCGEKEPMVADQIVVQAVHVKGRAGVQVVIDIPPKPLRPILSQVSSAPDREDYSEQVLSATKKCFEGAVERLLKAAQ